MKDFVDITKLHETANVESSFDYEGKDLIFLQEIKNISKNAIIGLIGSFGSGKTVFLNHIKDNLTQEKDIKWIFFDAWKFPERKNLWEGFLLEFAQQINKKEFDKMTKIVEGKQKKDIETLINTFASIPGLSSVKNLSHFVQTSPAKRVFEFHKIFIEAIKSANIKEGNIFIVIEDIDRSSDFGIFFLETLKNFLDNLPVTMEKKLKIIVPISPENLKNKFEEYLKCFDFQFDFEFPNDSMEKFVNDIFIHDKESDIDKDHLSGFLNEMRTIASMRLIKFILRKANIRYRELQNKFLNKEIEWKIVLAIETTKYFWSNYKNEPYADAIKTFFELTSEQKRIKNFSHYAKDWGIIFSSIRTLIFCVKFGETYEKIKKSNLYDLYFDQVESFEPKNNSANAFSIPEFYLN